MLVGVMIVVNNLFVFRKFFFINGVLLGIVLVNK